MLRKLLVIACLPFILVACGTTILTSTPSPSAADGYAAYPAFKKPNAKKVVLVILENTNPDHARAEPFLNCLVGSGAYLGNYYAVAHPSQPNYIALVSGSTQGVDGDSAATLDRPFLGDEEHRLDWKVFAVFFGDDVKAGYEEPALYTHYDLLNTFETIYDIKPMAPGDRNARVIRGIWQPEKLPGNSQLHESCNKLWPG